MYGIRYWTRIQDTSGGWLEMRLLEKDYLGDAVYQEAAGNPISHELGNVDADSWAVVRSALVEWFPEVNADDPDRFESFFGEAADKYRMTLYYNGERFFSGPVKTDMYQEVDNVYPLYPTVRATDNLEALKSVPYPNAGEGRATRAKIATRCLAATGTEIGLCIADSLFADNMSQATNDDNPWGQALIDQARYIDERGEPWSSWDVLHDIIPPGYSIVMDSGPVGEGNDPDEDDGSIDGPQPVEQYNCPAGTTEGFGSDIPRTDAIAHATAVGTGSRAIVYVNGVGWHGVHFTLEAPATTVFVRWDYNIATDTWTVGNSFQLFAASSPNPRNLEYAPAKNAMYCDHGNSRIAKIDLTAETYTVNGTADGAISAATNPIYIASIDKVVCINGISIVFFDPDTLARTKVLTSILVEGTPRFLYYNPVTDTIIATTTKRVYEISLADDSVVKFAIYDRSQPDVAAAKYWELYALAPHGTNNQKLIGRALYYWNFGDVTSTSNFSVVASGNITFGINTGLEVRAGMLVYVDSFAFDKGVEGLVVSYNPDTGVLVMNVTGSYGSGAASEWYFNLEGRNEIVEIDLATGTFPMTIVSTASEGDADENSIQRIQYSPVTQTYYFSNIISNRNELYTFKPEMGKAEIIADPGVANMVTGVRTEDIFSVVMYQFSSATPTKHYGCIADAGT